MEIERSIVLAASADAVFALVDDLDRYPQWMQLVHDVAIAPPTDDDQPAWEVELQAQVGPFARSKRLRMVRTVHEPTSAVVFERDELDGRRHSPWVLRCAIVPDAGEHVRLTMTLVYGGNLWTGAVLQRVLDDHVERGAVELSALLADRGRPVD
ncbi:MAG: SRPBCC family protein [Ilumatobacteraceae bacterium]|jgi:hypothetical protein